MAGPSEAIQLITILGGAAIPALNTMIIYDPLLLPKNLKDLFAKPTNAMGWVKKAKQLNKVAESVFRFRINPNQLNVTRDKVQSLVLTKKGYDNQYWRNKMVSLSYKGRSGYFRPPSVSLREMGVNEGTLRRMESNPIVKNIMNDTRLSYAWLKFQRFQEFYDTRESDMVLIFDGIFYTGFFETFNWSQSTDSPYVIQYDFKFLAYPDQIYNLFTKVPAVFTAF
jgi:hypothetical protein